MTEVVSHTALTTHSPPFSLVGNGRYQVTLNGTIANGAQPPELMQQVAGAYVSLNPPVRFLNGEQNGTRQTAVLPPSNFRWTVAGPHNVNTSITRV
jgi:hypothetical protein